MTKAELIERINKHNESIDAYFNGELAKKLSAKNGKIPVDSWFKAQKLISEQNFYEKGMKILRPARQEGFDVKMDMQSHKLALYERLI